VPVADNPGVVACGSRAGNTGALHLYQSLGFTEYGRLKDFVAIGSHRYDMVLCALDLREHRGVTPG
jgi:ribosomal protein S18 acetylase RimI-like enzyme